MGLAAKNAKSAKKTWPMVRLGDVCEIRAGATHHGIESETGPYPVYGSGGYICQATEYRCPANTVTVGRKGTLDKPLLIEEPFWNIDTCFGVIPNESLDARYLWRFCQNFDFYSLIPSIGRPSTNSEAIKLIQFPLPPISVQREIVARLEKELGEADALAAKFKEIAENADAEFKAELDETFKNVEGETVRLGDVGRVAMCKRILKAQTKDIGEIPFYKIGTFGKSPNAYISRAVYDEYVKKYSYPTKGDILISAAGTIGRTVVFDGEPAYFQDSNIVWFEHDRQRLLNEYLLYFYLSNPWSISVGVTIPRIYNGDIESLEIPAPPIAAQREIVSVLDAAKEKCEKLKAAAERGLRVAEDLRKSILAEAFEQ